MIATLAYSCDHGVGHPSRRYVKPQRPSGQRPMARENPGHHLQWPLR